MTFLQHPLSAAFPAMQDEEFQGLMDSILEIGVQSPITLFEGMVIDGWNRYRAAAECGQHCPTVELGDVDPLDFVKGQNLHRRHLTGSQRAAAVVACSAWRPAHRAKKSVPSTDLSKTDAEMAKEAGVSVSTIGHAKVAQKAGILDPVRDGGMTAKEAVNVVRGKTEKPAKPAHVEPEDAEYTGPSATELQAAQDTAKADLDTVMELLESDDPKAALLKENERLRMALAATESQRDGYMNQTNELIRRVKSLRKQVDKLQGK